MTSHDMEFKGILSTCKRGGKEISEEDIITMTQGRDNDGLDQGENSESGKKKKSGQVHGLFCFIT